MSKTWRIILIMTLILFVGLSILGSKNPFISTPDGSGFEGIIDYLGSHIETLFKEIYNYFMN